MRVEELVPGLPAYCERCGDRIVIQFRGRLSNVRFEAFHDDFIKLIDLLTEEQRRDFEILCDACEGLPEVPTVLEQILWDTTQQDSNQSEL